MLSLDRTAPMSTTYGPDTAGIPFYQDGLYFDRAGKLVDMPHNRSVVASRGMSWEQAIADGSAAPAPVTYTQLGAQVVQPPSPAEPVAAESPDDGLGGKSAAQVYAMSQKLRAQLDVEGDADVYVPTLENMEGNLEFIRKHLKGE